MNKQDRKKLMMKQRGEDTNTYKTLVEHLHEQKTEGVK